MNEADISRYITETFEGVDVVVNSGTSFFFYNPPDLPTDHMFPFVTMVASDVHDQFSNLDRPSVFRLNIGIGKQTFRALFGKPNLPPYGDNAVKSHYSDYDFTALDTLMP